MNNKNDALLDKFYEIVIPEFKSQYSNRESLEFLLDYYFEGTSFQNKTVIDIGGGSGLYSIYAAVNGAKQVVCLEPELCGSDKSRHQQFNRIVGLLSLKNILRKSDIIQHFEPGDQKFDVILLMQSAHHFDEEAAANLETSQNARETYISIFKKLEKLAASGAELIVNDRSKYDFYKLLGVNTPFHKCQYWDINPRPQVWIDLLKEVGFGEAKIRWQSYKKFGIIGKKILATKFFNYFLKNVFVINMKRVRS